MSHSSVGNHQNASLIHSNVHNKRKNPPNHYPFHNLSSDCQHLILHYHIFHLEIFDFSQQRRRYNSYYDSDFGSDDYDSDNSFDHDSDNSDNDAEEEIRVKELGISTPTRGSDYYSITDESFKTDTPEWQFLQKYAHCVEFSPQESDNHDSDPMDFLVNYFLHNCRHMKHKEAFHYLAISDEGMHLMPELLRCVPKLDLKELVKVRTDGSSRLAEKLLSIMENLRGVENLALSFSGFSVETSCFENLRGVKELSLLNYVETDVDSLQKVVENFRGLKKLTLKQCRFPCIGSLFKNLRGIQELDIANLRTSRLQVKDFRNLRGIRKLSLRSIFEEWGPQTFTGEMMEQLQGIEELSIMDMSVEQLTNQAFESLRGIRKLTIDASGLNNVVTAEAFVNLRGIESLTIRNFDLITNAIFSQLRGIKELSISSCSKVRFTAAILRNLRGIRSLHWNENSVFDRPTCLDDECLQQLSGVKKLHLSKVHMTSSDVESFRHLKHVTDLHLQSVWGSRVETPESDTPLTYTFFSYLKSVQRMDLSNLKIEVQDFRRLFREQMPQLSTFCMYGCHVLKSSMETISERDGFTLVQYRELQSPKGWVVGGFEKRFRDAQ